MEPKEDRYFGERNRHPLSKCLFTSPPNPGEENLVSVLVTCPWPHPKNLQVLERTEQDSHFKNLQVPERTEQDSHSQLCCSALPATPPQLRAAGSRPRLCPPTPPSPSEPSAASWLGLCSATPPHSSAQKSLTSAQFVHCLSRRKPLQGLEWMEG